MKKVMTITVDYDAYIMAKEKLDNISSYINDCLLGLNDIKSDRKKQDIKDEIDNITNSLNDLRIKKQILEMDYKILDEKEAEDKKQMKLKAAYKRWICPACLMSKHEVLNLMENMICSRCNLKTRDNPKTTFKFIEED